jgi:hypothetical protein
VNKLILALCLAPLLAVAGEPSKVNRAAVAIVEAEKTYRAEVAAYYAANPTIALYTTNAAACTKAADLLLRAQGEAAVKKIKDKADKAKADAKAGKAK